MSGRIRSQEGEFGSLNAYCNIVTEQKFGELVENFDERLRAFDKIYFYYNPERFHPLYKRLFKETGASRIGLSRSPI